LVARRAQRAAQPSGERGELHAYTCVPHSALLRLA